MDIVEGKIRQVLYRMIEKRKGEYARSQMKIAMMSAVSSQIEQGRLDEDRKDALLDFIKILLEEHYESNRPSVDAGEG